MAHQPRNIKPTAEDKRRVNIYQLAQEVKRQHGVQNKINARQAQINTENAIQTEEIMARLAKLERIVLPEHKTGFAKLKALLFRNRN